jgi:hypothetical protein
MEFVNLFNLTLSPCCLCGCHQLLMRHFSATSSLRSGKSLMASCGLLTRPAIFADLSVSEKVSTNISKGSSSTYLIHYSLMASCGLLTRPAIFADLSVSEKVSTNISTGSSSTYLIHYSLMHTNSSLINKTSPKRKKKII